MIKLYYSLVRNILKNVWGDLGSSDPFGLVLLIRCVCNSIFQYEAFKLKHKVIQSITFRSKIDRSCNYPS